MVEIRAVLPAETGAELLTALELALDRDGTAPPSSTGTAACSASSSRAAAEPDHDGSSAIAERCAEITTEATLDQRRADALHDLARTYLAAEPDDRSGEDRHLVVVQVDAESLSERVPAGTLPRCGVAGGGPLEPRTAERLACTGKVSLALADVHGEILHLGRARRLASRAQRRALRLRDGTCVFPGCHQSKHLDAHHLTPWSEGGPTDLDELALLCRRHHVMVHEGGLRLVRAASAPGGVGPRFQVLDAGGRPVQARWPAMLERLILRPEVTRSVEAPSAQGGTGTTATGGAIGDGPVDDDASADGSAPGTSDSRDPERIAATTGGAGFRLADCVQAMCESVLARAA